MAQEIGSFTNDWSGNEIVVEAIEDPKIKGSPATSPTSSAA